MRAWRVQEKIEEDPSILGIGEVILKDQERSQPGAGRLDLLFQDPDSNLCYEVEIQLGKTDECHIFRAIEYWDLERKRYPQYDHIAILIAEDITSRFLNVISLLNTFIPLVAIQLNAIQVENQIALLFTVIVDQRLGLAHDEDEEGEIADRLPKQFTYDNFLALLAPMTWGFPDPFFKSPGYCENNNDPTFFSLPFILLAQKVFDVSFHQLHTWFIIFTWSYPT